jgi:Peptidase inhibitor I9
VRLFLTAIVLGCGLAFTGGALAGSGTAATGLPNQYIVVLEDDADVQAEALSASWLGADVFKRYDHALNGFAVGASPATLAVIAADPAVRFISPNLRGSVTSQSLPTGSTGSTASSRARSLATAAARFRSTLPSSIPAST